jgi:hypothetical protein
LALVGPERALEFTGVLKPGSVEIAQTVFARAWGKRQVCAPGRLGARRRREDAGGCWGDGHDRSKRDRWCSAGWRCSGLPGISVYWLVISLVSAC